MFHDQWAPIQTDLWGYAKICIENDETWYEHDGRCNALEFHHLILLQAEHLNSSFPVGKPSELATRAVAPSVSAHGWRGFGGHRPLREQGKCRPWGPGLRRMWLFSAVSWLYPRCSMYGIFTYIWAIFGITVGNYSIHGASGYWYDPCWIFSNTVSQTKKRIISHMINV